MKVWTLALCAARLATLVQADVPAVAPDFDEEDEEDDDGEDQDDESPYDPTNEPPIFPCRRNPQWHSTYYEECQELTEWNPDDVWTRLDHGNTELWLQDKEARLTECLDQAFADAPHEWAKCDEENKTEVCEVEIPAVVAHYYREGQGKCPRRCTPSKTCSHI